MCKYLRKTARLLHAKASLCSECHRTGAAAPGKKIFCAVLYRAHGGCILYRVNRPTGRFLGAVYFYTASLFWHNSQGECSYVQILREKAVHRGGGGDHGDCAGRDQLHQHDHGSSARHGTALCDGCYQLPGCQPGARGGGGDCAAGGGAGYCERCEKRDQHFQRECEHGGSGI